MVRTIQTAVKSVPDVGHLMAAKEAREKSPVTYWETSDGVSTKSLDSEASQKTMEKDTQGEFFAGLYLIRHHSPRKVALREIRRYQKDTDRLISRVRFQRLVKDIVRNLKEDHLRWQVGALDALHLATESYAIGLFEDANMKRKRITRVPFAPSDFDLTLQIRGEPRGPC